MSTTPNGLLMSQARDSLRGKWGLAIGAFVVYFLITNTMNLVSDAGFIIALLIGGPMSVGYAIFNLALSRKGTPKVEVIFQGFAKFGTALAAYLLVVIFVILWLLLLIVPGIIAALSYSQTWYIIAEKEDIGAREAINQSKLMMLGNKGKLFGLGLRFLGWIILGIITLGIGFLWIAPYINVSLAQFYDDLKPTEEQAMQNEIKD